MEERTARLNAFRGLLRELGVFIPVGSARRSCRRSGCSIEDADSGIPDECCDRFLAEAARRSATSRRADQEGGARSWRPWPSRLPAVIDLLTIPGIGLLTATALVALMVDVRRFPPGGTWRATSGSHRESSRAGNKRRLGADHQARGWLSTHAAHPRGAVGARAHAQAEATERRDGLREWATKLAEGPRTQQGSGSRWRTSWPAWSGRSGRTIALRAVPRQRRDCLNESTGSDLPPRSCQEIA